MSNPAPMVVYDGRTPRERPRICVRPIPNCPPSPHPLLGGVGQAETRDYGPRPRL